MVTLFKFNKKDWENLSNLKGSLEYMKSVNSDGSWSEAMQMEKHLFSQIVASKRSEK